MGKRANGEGSIYRLPDGTWRVLFTFTKPDGTPGRLSRKRKTQAAAKAVLDKLKGDVEAGVDFQRAHQSTASFLERWLADAVKPNAAENTYESYRNAIQKHVVPRIGTIKLAQLSASQIQSMLGAMERDEVGERTRQNCYIVLRTALQHATKVNEIRGNPAAKLDKPTVSPPEIRPFTASQTKSILNHVTGQPDEFLYRLAATTGMREGELFGLHWDAVDLDAAKIRIVQQATEVNGHVRVKPPKSKASIRVIDITPGIVAGLRELKKRAKKNQIVFPGETGNYKRRGSFTRWSWNPTLKALKLEHRGFHHLRHTAVTLMLNQGVPIQVVSRIIGHSSPAVTAKIYAHVLPGLESMARDRMSQLLD